jgi:hypothetical protein
MSAVDCAAAGMTLPTKIDAASTRERAGAIPPSLPQVGLSRQLRQDAPNSRRFSGTCPVELAVLAGAIEA